MPGGVMKKLVRNRIPDLLRADGVEFTVEVLDDDRYRSALLDKLREEVEEFIADPCVEEMADIEDVLWLLGGFFGLPRQDISKARQDKALRNGGFSKRYFVTIEDSRSKVINEFHDQLKSEVARKIFRSITRDELRSWYLAGHYRCTHDEGLEAFKEMEVLFTPLFLIDDPEEGLVRMDQEEVQMHLVSRENKMHSPITGYPVPWNQVITAFAPTQVLQRMMGVTDPQDRR